MARRRRGLGAASRCPMEGTRVRFQPNPASYALYSRAPKPGTYGRVTTVPLGGGRRATCMRGPGGGLVYVRWEGSDTMGVSMNDIVKVRW